MGTTIAHMAFPICICACCLWVSAKPSKCAGGHGMAGDILHSTIESRQKLLVSKESLDTCRTIIVVTSSPLNVPQIRPLVLNGSYKRVTR